MSRIFTVKGFANGRALYRMEITESKDAALRGAKEILKENPDVDRVEIRIKGKNGVLTIRRTG